MTANQIRYAEHLENKRSNVTKEAETHRHNLEDEGLKWFGAYETKRSNLAKESETHRANTVNEAEHQRSNLARETETNRANLVNEYLKTVAAEQEAQRHIWEKQDRFYNKAILHSKANLAANENVIKEIDADNYLTQKAWDLINLAIKPFSPIAKF